MMNVDYGRDIKYWTDELLKQKETDEKILKKKSKIDWFQLGDGNNDYFFANIKEKNKKTTIISLIDQQGNKLTEFRDLEKEISELI